VGRAEKALSAEAAEHRLLIIDEEGRGREQKITCKYACSGC
jgi:hypothetical protein